MQLVDDILAILRQPEDRRLAGNIDRLVLLHTEITRTSVPGFLYRGIHYRHTQASKGKLELLSIHPSLYPEIEYHLANESATNVDLQVVRQVILSLVKDCTDAQDIRDALPNCLVQAVASPTLNALQRTRDPGWNMDPESRAYRQYLKYLPKMEFFAAARLMY